MRSYSDIVSILTDKVKASGLLPIEPKVKESADGVAVEYYLSGCKIEVKFVGEAWHIRVDAVGYTEHESEVIKRRYRYTTAIAVVLEALEDATSL